MQKTSTRQSLASRKSTPWQLKYVLSWSRYEFIDSIVVCTCNRLLWSSDASPRSTIPSCGCCSHPNQRDRRCRGNSRTTHEVAEDGRTTRSQNYFVCCGWCCFRAGCSKSDGQ